jgi:hypothetical protein
MREEDVSEKLPAIIFIADSMIKRQQKVEGVYTISKVV